jgi:ACS family D-galactonate transporter-like MFS transporter
MKSEEKMADPETQPKSVGSTSVVVRWTIIVLLSLGMVIAYASRSNVGVAITVPHFVETFQLSDTDRGTLNSAFFWTYALLQIPAGWVVDRFGVKIPYALSFIFWCLASAATAFGRTVTQLLSLRMLVGAGEAIVAPASYRWIRHNFEEKQRGLANGIYMAGTKIGPAIGTPLAVWLVVRFDWRMMFVVIGLGGLIWLIPWMLLVKRDDRKPAAPVAKAGAAPVAKAGATPVPFGRIMASPVMWGTIIGTFSYMYFVYFCMTWMPAYFVEQRNLSLSKMGLYTFFSFGGMALVAILAGWAADRIIARGHNAVTVRKWFTIAGFMVACTELIGAQSSSVNVSLFWAIVSLSGLGLATANYWAITQTLIPAASIGKASGVQNTSASIAGIVAPILTGWLKQSTGNYQAPMQTIWFFLVLGVLCYMFLVREKYAPKAREATR